MIALKLYGSINSTYEYIKMMLHRLANQKNVELKLLEINAVESFIEKGIDHIPTLFSENEEIRLSYNNHEGVNEFIDKADEMFFSKNHLKTQEFLVPIDFSESSQNTIEYLYNILKGKRANITLLHCLKPILEPEMVQMFDEYERTQKETFLGISSQFEKRISLDEKINVTPKFEVGFPAELILKNAESNNSIIIMGSKGSGNRIKKYFGSVSTKVVSESNNPVLIIPPKVKYKSIKTVAIAIEELSIDDTTLTKLDKIIDLDSIKIQLLYVSSKVIDINKVNEFVRSIKIRYPRIDFQFNNILSLNINKGIQEFVNENPIDLLTMTQKKKKLIEKILNKSLTRSMSIYTQVPLLILHSN